MVFREAGIFFLNYFLLRYFYYVYTYLPCTNQNANQCTALMYERFVSKAQVSKYEKFGFGILLLHLAATQAGASALHAAGFFQIFVDVRRY